jgi:hypothetical protein
MSAVDPVFNEPSAEPLATTETEARSRMNGVLDVLLLMPRHGLGKGLRISDEFYQLALAPRYNLTDWINDPRVGRDHLNLFLGLAAKAPYLRSSDCVALQRIEDTDVTCYGQGHPAFLAAHALGAPMVSFDHDAWSEPDLPVTVTRLGDEGELDDEQDTIANFARPDHFDHHAPWFARRNAVTDAADLWSRRAELFPNLVFSEPVEGQLQQQQTILSLIVDRLKDIERVAASGRPFDKDAFAFRCNATSAATFQQFGSAYVFTAPDGVSTRCGWHFYLPDGRRIYFSTDFVIGHVGEHLPTAKFH